MRPARLDLQVNIYTHCAHNGTVGSQPSHCHCMYLIHRPFFQSSGCTRPEQGEKQAGNNTSRYHSVYEFTGQSNIGSTFMSARTKLIMSMVETLFSFHFPSGSGMPWLASRNYYECASQANTHPSAAQSGHTCFLWQSCIVLPNCTAAIDLGY